MCGIGGIVGLRNNVAPPDREQLLDMARALRHRGPDEFGLYRDARAGLSHTRLSIVDLSTGQQPLANEDESLWVVFNGEIFNYVELRETLVAHGHRFRTQSDTEVIVHAYEEWGSDAFQRMNGQWAIALWDTRRERLVLSRDRLGVRPLYVCEHAGRVYFASEVKAIFAADTTIPRALDPIGLEQTFTFWSVVPPQTVFSGVEELRPGHVRTYENGASSEHPYWQPSYEVSPAADSGAGVGAAADDVYRALDRAVALRMLRADVPVGSYLSGGLDSSFVAALGRRYAGDRFRTFSLRFADAEYDETPFQRQMAEALGSQHEEVTVSREDIGRVFPEVVWHAERPILRTAPAPLFLLSKLVHDAGIKVVLTGEGADEMFAGYDLFREGKVRRFWAKSPQSACRPRLLERLYPYLARSPVSQQAMARQFFGRGLDRCHEPGSSHSTRWETTSALKRLFSPAVRDATKARDVTRELLQSLPSDFSRWSPLAQDQYLEVRTLLDGYLLSSQGDRMLMAHSVEGRFPFLDKDVVELANSLSPEHKLRVLDEKHVLKRAARDLVPDDILARKKQPYRAPDAVSFLGGATAYVDELLDESALVSAAIFDPAPVGRLLRKCRETATTREPSNSDNMALVGVLSTQLLHHHFVGAFARRSGDIALRTDIDRIGGHGS